MVQLPPAVPEPSVLRPGPVHDNRIDPSRDEEAVAKVSVEVESFSNSSSRDGGGGGCKGPLEEKVLPVDADSVDRSVCIVKDLVVGVLRDTAK